MCGEVAEKTRIQDVLVRILHTTRIALFAIVYICIWDP